MARNISIGSEVDVLISHRPYRFSIVEAKGDPDAGIISFFSPIGQALVGKEEGEEIDVVTPTNVLKTKILKVY